MTQSFQSTLPRGERRQPTKHSKERKEFQSTLPRGERRRRGRLRDNLANFNPRSHEGSDEDDDFDADADYISIHAPTRGAT